MRTTASSDGYGLILVCHCANPRIRNASSTNSAISRIPTLGIPSAIAFVSAALRELTYPQPLLFKRYTFFNPPPVGRIYIVIAYLSLILFLLFYQSIVTGPMYWESIAYRAAWCSVGQVPLIFLLAMKNSIVGTLIGSSHDRINFLHRTVARCLFLTVTIHFSFFWSEWNYYHVVESELVMMPMVKYGMGAYFTLMWIVFTSFAPIRNIRYEFFVAQHIISFFVFITMLLLHVPPYARVYVLISIGFFAVDRILRYARLLYHNLSLFHRKSKSGFACRAHLTVLPGQATRVTIKNPPLASWSPGQHVFLSFLSISPLQSHPFTIASTPADKELSFVVRAHAGFSRRLYNRATSLLPTTSQADKEKSFIVFFDGPYGCPPTFLQYDTVVLIAGSTGVTFTMPILKQAVQSASPHCIRRMEFLWIIKAGSHIEWYAEELTRAMELAEDRGIELIITCCITCDPTYTTNHPIRPPPRKCTCCCNDNATDNEKEDNNSLVSSISSQEALAPCSCMNRRENISVCVSAGRPDIREVVDRNLRCARGETGVAVCGPVGLMARTRNVVAELSDERGAGKGTGAYGVSLFGEGFGW